MDFIKICEGNYIQDEQNSNELKISIDSNLRDWLNEIGDLAISIDWSSEYLYLSGLKTLEAYQEGYEGDDWQASWIVFAKWIGDPIIYDTESKKILTSMHGAGVWKPYPLSPTLEKFNLILSTWCSLYHGKYKKNIHDDDFELLNEFVNDLKNSLLEVIDKKYVDGFLKFISS